MRVLATALPLAAGDALSADQKTTAIDHILSFTGGIKKPTYGRGACEALVRSRDPRAAGKKSRWKVPEEGAGRALPKTLNQAGAGATGPVPAADLPARLRA